MGRFLACRLCRQLALSDIPEQKMINYVLCASIFYKFVFWIQNTVHCCSRLVLDFSKIHPLSRILQIGLKFVHIMNADVYQSVSIKFITNFC